MTDKQAVHDSYSPGESGTSSTHIHQPSTSQSSYDFSQVLGVKSFSPQSHYNPSSSNSTSSYSHTPLGISICRPSSNSHQNQNQSDLRSPDNRPDFVLSPSSARGGSQAAYVYSNISIQHAQFPDVGFGLGDYSGLGISSNPSGPFVNLGGLHPVPRYSQPSAGSGPIYDHQSFPQQVPSNYSHEYVDDSWRFSYSNSPTTGPSGAPQDVIYSQVAPPRNHAGTSPPFGTRPSTDFSGMVGQHQRRKLPLPSNSGPPGLDVRASTPYYSGRPCTPAPVQSSPTSCTSGSFDPSTGLFSKTSEHTRMRTAQACEWCRIRKSKCDGQPQCERCTKKGLECKYARERKMRGPNKPKAKSLNDLYGSASTARSSEKSKGNVVKRRSSDVSRNGLKTFKVENSEEYGRRAATRTNAKKGRQSKHVLDGIHGNGAPRPPNHQNVIRNVQAMEGVPRDPTWPKNSEPEDMAWNWATKFEEQEGFPALANFGGLRYPRMKDSYPHSPGVSSSMSVDTTNLTGFGSGSLGTGYEGESPAEVSPTQSSFDYSMSEHGGGRHNNTMESPTAYDIRHQHPPPPPSVVHIGSQAQNSTNANEAYVQQRGLSYNHSGVGTPTTSSDSPVTPLSAGSASSMGYNSRDRDVEMQVSGHERGVGSRMNGDEYRDVNNSTDNGALDRQR